VIDACFLRGSGKEVAKKRSRRRTRISVSQLIWRGEANFRRKSTGGGRQASEMRFNRAAQGGVGWFGCDLRLKLRGKPGVML